ncbi:PIN domain-containing protein [Candidatus Acetothermia bacterium]|jgi:predicted nucleic acid-binding protein|nr:PIN domain-containing protein [Candidatus Acetothermia bacterium]MCI2436780.1 PIN domain-containing protein [Candidatus Acetothermia bacterium]
MAAELLLDTGAFIALVDRSERHHAACVKALEEWTGPIVTTEAVLTETLYLVGPAWEAQRVSLEFFLRGAFLLIPSSVSSLQRVAVLMEQYRDIPMDFADATLVVLGEELGTDCVFTLDRRGFSAYRLQGQQPFRLIPQTSYPPSPANRC